MGKELLFYVKILLPFIASIVMRMVKCYRVLLKIDFDYECIGQANFNLHCKEKHRNFQYKNFKIIFSEVTTTACP